jgi:hypothetical protein
MHNGNIAHYALSKQAVEKRIALLSPLCYGTRIHVPDAINYQEDDEDQRSLEGFFLVLLKPHATPTYQRKALNSEGFSFARNKRAR